MNQWRRAAAWLFAALLFLALGACGEQDPNAGVYLCTEVTVGEDTVRPEKLYNGEVRLTLVTGGRGVLRLGEYEGELRWRVEDGALRVEINGTACPGTLADGEIRLDLLGEGVVLTLLREDLAAALPTPTAQPALLTGIAGDWYGWWQIENAEGAMPETWYDCCASCVPTEDGALLTLWDEMGSRAEPMGALALTGDGEALSASGGWFWFETVEEGALTMSFADGVLTVSGRHDAEGERFAFRILLRPWGADWTDTDETPYSYRFWYRPLIEAGEAMPDRIQQVLER